MLFGDGPKGNKFANAGIGENNIDAAFHLGNGLVKTIKVGKFGSVALNARNIAADCLHGLVEFLLSAARDDSDLAFEFFNHSFPLLLPSSSRTSRHGPGGLAHRAPQPRCAYLQIPDGLLAFACCL